MVGLTVEILKICVLPENPAATTITHVAHAANTLGHAVHQLACYFGGKNDQRAEK